MTIKIGSELQTFTLEETIQALVRTAVATFANGFEARHQAEATNPEGIINMKIHNVFIEALGKEIQYYTALVRSLDSSLGNMLESLAINIAKLNFEVKRYVEGPLSVKQTRIIAELLERYKRREIKPSIKNYLVLRKIFPNTKVKRKRHDSDYYLIDKKTSKHYLIELKIGGDLDNKKARSEKEAILEQFTILSNILPKDTDIKIYFATAYNRFGEDKPWNQERVKQFFAKEELLIGRDFWNFICQSSRGYDTVISTYKKNSHFIKKALENIKKVYLGKDG
ncbi:TdeIII family type II restriction endonuclease [Candidatus Pacearchaeota archaeon]|nr:TdeIII family type II restriction endonuclease [Candidatus Pacearchaeota archaeon]